MKSKKIISMVAAVLMMTSVALPASASAKDTTYEFKFNWAQTVWQTAGRNKDNATSTYVKTEWIPAGGYQVYVEGYNGSKYTDCTARTAYIHEIGEGQVQNYVYENGYRTARLAGYKERANTFASGKWSPDSVGSYQKYNK